MHFHSSLTHITHQPTTNNNSLHSHSFIHIHTHIITMRFSTISILAAILTISYQGMHPPPPLLSPTLSTKKRERLDLTTRTPLLKRIKGPCNKGLSHRLNSTRPTTLITMQLILLPLHKEQRQWQFTFSSSTLFDANLQPNYFCNIHPQHTTTTTPFETLAFFPFLSLCLFSHTNVKPLQTPTLTHFTPVLFLFTLCSTWSIMSIAHR